MGHIGTWLRSSAGAGDTVDSQRIAEDSLQRLESPKARDGLGRTVCLIRES